MNNMDINSNNNSNNELIQKKEKRAPGGFFVYKANEKEEIVYADYGVINIFECDDFDDFFEFTNGTFEGMVHPDDYAEMEYTIWNQLNDKKLEYDYVKYRIITKKGNIKQIEDFGHLVNMANGESFFYVLIIEKQDVIPSLNLDRMIKNDDLYVKEEYDILTGLFKMHKFFTLVEDESLDKEKVNAGMFVVYFDVESFKSYNENYGYDRGDELLCFVAKILENEFPDGIISRFSDDHFAVCCQSDEIVSQIERIHRKVDDYSEGRPLEIKAGIYPIYDVIENGSIVCDRARIACSEIKGRFDEFYNYYDEDLGYHVKQQQYIIDNFDEALQNGSIKVYYQPIVRVMTGKVCAFEALARWQDDEYGMISPGVFIEVLEKFHLIHKLDLYMIRKVCQDYDSKKKYNRSCVPVSINLSRLDFQLCHIFKLIEEIRNEYNVPTKMIDIEITESALNNDLDYLKLQIMKFKQAGYNVWVDDFGSGYSALNILTNYEFDVAKLDMSFIKQFNDIKMKIMIQSLIYVIKDIGIQSFAEGVETIEQYEFLKSIGCEKVQGFFFGKPLPLLEVYHYIDANGMQLETFNECSYQDKIGRLNIKNNLKNKDSKSDFPSAIIEIEEDRVSFLFASDAFKQEIAEVGFESVENLEKFCNENKQLATNKISELVQNSILSGKEEKTDWIIRGKYCYIWIDVIAVYGKCCAAKTMILNRQKYIDDCLKIEEMDSYLRELYTIYNRVDMLDIDDNQVETIYTNSKAIAPMIAKREATGIIEYVADKYIHPDDRKNFCKLYDISTIEQRIFNEENDFLWGVYRVKVSNKYVWQIFNVIFVKREEKRFIISCMRDMYDRGESLFGLQEFNMLFENFSLPFIILKVEVEKKEKITDLVIKYSNEKFKQNVKEDAEEKSLKELDMEIYEVLKNHCYRAAYLDEDIHEKVYCKSLDIWLEVVINKIARDGFCAVAMKDITEEYKKSYETDVKFSTDNFIIRCAKILQGTTSFKYRINHILKEIGNALKPTRAYIIEISYEEVFINFVWIKDEQYNDVEVYNNLNYDIIKQWPEYAYENDRIMIDVDRRINTAQLGDMFRLMLLRHGIHRVIMVPLYDDNGAIIGYLGVENFENSTKYDINNLLDTISYFISTEMRKHELIKNLEYLGKNDVMTGVRNRYSMDQEIARVENRRCAVGVIFIDVNGMKKINDMFGHEKGDKVIIDVARAIRSVFNKNNIYRAGGDEFVVILEDISESLFEEKVNDLRKLVSSTKRFTISFGFAWDDGKKDFKNVMRIADAFMYKNKAEYYRILTEDEKTKKNKKT